MLHWHYFTFNPYQENTYLLWDDNKDAVILDPGCSNETEQKQLENYIAEHKLKPQQIVNTHCHIDHVLGNKWCKDRYNIALAVPEDEQEVLEAQKVLAPMFGTHNYQPTEPDQLLPKQGFIEVGEEQLKILYVPGHSPGHLAFYHKGSGTCFNGDVLFNGSVGRTDLPGGDHQQLLHSIQTQLYTLPEGTRVFCGHGPETSIGYERLTNPFVKAEAPKE